MASIRQRASVRGALAPPASVVISAVARQERANILLAGFVLLSVGGIVLAFSEKTALGSRSRLGAQGLPKRQAQPLSIHRDLKAGYQAPVFDRLD